MIMRNSDFLSGKFQPVGKELSCPECNTQMIEVDRHDEKQALFVWYECIRENCDGQWLQKMPITITK